ncbi:MAG: sensor histidine kinase [Myxococcales bacterium]|nr:MAG: sensor histidine kinase [Myxococcales bacterium]
MSWFGKNRMLCEFIITNRDQIIERARQRARSGNALKVPEARLDFGVHLLVTQLVEALAGEESSLHLAGGPPIPTRLTSTRVNSASNSEFHEMLKGGCSVEQLVHGYRDVFQAVSGLAHELEAPISLQELHVFNRCLDLAIAGAVAVYGKPRERTSTCEGTERVGDSADELRDLLNAAVLSFGVIQRGAVGLGGSTSAAQPRSLAGLRGLAERSLTEVRLASGQTRLEPLRLAELIEEVRMSAELEAEGHHLRLEVVKVQPDLVVEADRQLLSSALSNLVQNGFEYSPAGGTVRLRTHATEARVLIEVSDSRGGLPPDMADALCRRFEGGGGTGRGLGLGLSMALNAVRVQSGQLLVRNVPGKGCVLTIVLPRRTRGSLFQVLPHGRYGPGPSSDHERGRGAHFGGPRAQVGAV